MAFSIEYEHPLAQPRADATTHERSLNNEEHDQNIEPTVCCWFSVILRIILGMHALYILASIGN